MLNKESEKLDNKEMKKKNNKKLKFYQEQII